MKLSMEQAAYVIGKTKKTMYNHKEADKFSWETNNDGNIVIDAAELMRVYGNEEPIPTRLKELQEGTSESVITQNYTSQAPAKKAAVKEDEYLELNKLREENRFKEQRISDLETEKEKWENLATEAQSTAQKITLLLEDQRKDQNKEQDKSKDWEKLFEKQQEQFANQLKEISKENEKSTQDAIKNALEEQERKRQIAVEKRREAMRKRKEERERKKAEEEKNKTLLQRLFG